MRCFKRKYPHGLFCSGAAAATIVSNPMTSPEPPAPAMALPMMNITDDEARATIKEPISKTASAKRNTS